MERGDQESLLAIDDDAKADSAKTSTTTNDYRSVVEDTETVSKGTGDPLKWFGILVPPALRSSQGNFKEAVTDAIPALATVSREMKELEIEVRRTRKRLRKAI